MSSPAMPRTWRTIAKTEGLRARRLREVLEAIQWRGCREDGEPSCPVCWGQPHNGHLSGCEIGAALAETAEQTGP